MKHMTRRALLGASATLALVPAGAAAATTVTVRVEGTSKTRLAPTSVRVPNSGSETKGGAPAGACPAHSAAGALQVATHGRWNGSYSANLGGTFVTSIFGERYGLKANRYWEVFVNNVAAMSGICLIQPRRHQQLLFAAVPVSDASDLPLGFRGLPARARTGHAVSFKVVAFDAKGKSHPLAGAVVSAGGARTTSGVNGSVTLTPTRPGRLTVHATHPGFTTGGAHTGYIRATGSVRVAA